MTGRLRTGVADALVAAVLITAGAWSPCVAQGPPGHPVDLTHAFGDSTIYWPTADPFELVVEAHGRTEGGWWYAANSFSAAIVFPISSPRGAGASI